MKKFHELYEPKPKDEKAFVAQHTVKKTTDKSPATDGKDNAFVVKTRPFARGVHRFGYDADSSEKAYGTIKGNPSPTDQKTVTTLSSYTVKNENEMAEGEVTDHNNAKKLGWTPRKIGGWIHVEAGNKGHKMHGTGVYATAKDAVAHSKKKGFVVKEEEQLDEISKKVLKSYVKKAAAEIHSAAYTQAKFGSLGDYDTMDKYGAKSKRRQKGIFKAVDKVAEEDEEQSEDTVSIDEISAKKLTNYISKASDARGHRKLPIKKVDNRYAGVALADKKLNNKRKPAKVPATEEVELEELSRGTLSSYIKKAQNQPDRWKTAKKVRDKLKKKDVKEDLNEAGHTQKQKDVYKRLAHALRKEDLEDDVIDAMLEMIENITSYAEQLDEVHPELKAAHLASGDEHMEHHRFHTAEHHRISGAAHNDLKKKGIDAGPTISGSVSKQFAAHTQTELRHHAYAANEHADAAMAHYKAAGLQHTTAKKRYWEKKAPHMSSAGHKAMAAITKEPK